MTQRATPRGEAASRLARVSAGAEGGFTIVEILVALIVMTVGFLGVLAMHMTASKSNQTSLRFDRAVSIAEDTMETYRGLAPTTLTAGTTTLPDFTTPDGTVFHRRVVIGPAAGNPALILISVETSFGIEGDETDLKTARLQMVRTAVERF